MNMFKSALGRLFFRWHLESVKRVHNRYKRYVYRIDKIDPQPLVRRLPKSFSTVRVLKYFYLTLTYKHFRQISRRAASSQGDYEPKFCFFLEARIVCLLLRANFVRSMFEAVSLLKERVVLVNRRVVSYLNFAVLIGDMIKLEEEKKNILRLNMYSRILKGNLWTTNLRYFFLNLNLLYFNLYQEPYDNDLPFPVKIDIYRAVRRY